VVEPVDALTPGRPVAIKAAGLLIAAFTVVVSCGEPSPGLTTTTGLPPPAEPHAAPEQTRSLPGWTVLIGDAPEGVVVDGVTRTVAVAKRNPNELVLLNADTGDVTGRTPLPGSVRHLQLAAPGGPVLVPVESANALVRVELPSGRADPPITVGTGPHDATQVQNGIVFVTNEFGGSVTALRDDTVVKDFGGSVQPGGLAAVGDLVGVIDVRQNDLTVYDAAALTVVGSVAAGTGPTHVIGDRHGRMIVTDTRGDTMRVFSPRPTPREVTTVEQPGGPYGIAYDATRDRLWVTSTGTNEVVGYDMADATPREVRRLPTVQNPNTLGVDPATGRLFIAGVPGGVVQIVDPPA
jgi:DNA-binding beta-propeller fold protein YncE